MGDGGPEQIAVQPPRRGRWLRRELWFVVAAVAAILAVFLAVRHKPPTHAAPGAPAGTIPLNVAPAVPAARPAETGT